MFPPCMDPRMMGNSETRIRERTTDYTTTSIETFKGFMARHKPQVVTAQRTLCRERVDDNHYTNSYFVRGDVVMLTATYRMETMNEKERLVTECRLKITAQTLLTFRTRVDLLHILRGLGVSETELSGIKNLRLSRIHTTEEEEKEDGERSTKKSERVNKPKYEFELDGVSVSVRFDEHQERVFQGAIYLNHSGKTQKLFEELKSAIPEGTFLAEDCSETHC